VISSEYEGALHMFSRALARFGFAEDEIDPLLSRIRAHTYRGITPRSSEGLPLAKIEKRFEENRIFSVPVGKEAQARGKTIGGLEALLPPGVSLVAIRRKGRTLAEVPGDFVPDEGDTLLFSGPPGRAEEVAFLVSGE